MALTASLPNNFLLPGAPATVERRLAAANGGFYSHRVRNRLFFAENTFSGVEIRTGNLLQTPIDRYSEVSIKNKQPAILEPNWPIARD